MSMEIAPYPTGLDAVLLCWSASEAGKAPTIRAESRPGSHVHHLAQRAADVVARSGRGVAARIGGEQPVVGTYRSI